RSEHPAEPPALVTAPTPRIDAHMTAFVGAISLPPALADAFGWRALARPLAPAALGAVMVAVGGVLGAATAPAAGDLEAYVYLAAGLDPAGGFSAEVASWAEQ
ncbi:MAG: hypothetical protein ACK4NP_15270, partial [Parvularculaceae bacterium]